MRTYLFVFAGLAAFLSSCCHKVACVAFNGVEVQFSAIDPNDTVFVRSFANNGEFNILTSETSLNNEFDRSHYFVQSGSDWELEVASSNRKYRISNFVLEKRRCSQNACLLQKGEEYYILKSYALNGTVQSNGAVTIEK